MRLFLLSLLAAAAHAQPAATAPPARAEEPRQPTPDELAGSSWRRMTGLALRRFAERADALPMGSRRAHDMYRECIDDAWFLGEPAFVQGERAPCARVLSGKPDGKAMVRSEVRGASTEPGLAGFRTCSEHAWESNPAVLDRLCAPALARRAETLPQLDDDRLAAWLGACKTSLTGGTPNSAFVPPAERADFERHCLRNLQILYDATGKQRLSDWWTAEEMQKLQKRKSKE